MEILWCIQTVMTHRSLRTAESDIHLLKLMFPDEIFIKNMELARTKITSSLMA